MRRYLSAGEIAKLEKVDKSTVTHWIKKGLFENITTAGHRGRRARYLIPLESYAKFKSSKKR